MLELIFHPDTADEIKHAYDWYQRQMEGLGEDFIEELESACQAIVQLPETWPKYTRHCRRFLLRKFPFSVVYTANDDSVFVLAVMHNSRRPGYWKKRL